jgi:hypothetical protein
VAVAVAIHPLLVRVLVAQAVVELVVRIMKQQQLREISILVAAAVAVLSQQLERLEVLVLPSLKFQPYKIK